MKTWLIHTSRQELSKIFRLRISMGSFAAELHVPKLMAQLRSLLYTQPAAHTVAKSITLNAQLGRLLYREAEYACGKAGERNC